MVVGTPEVVCVYAYDDQGRREQQFSDKYLYLNLSSVEHGCNLELTFQSNAATGTAEAEEEEESENSEDSWHSKTDSGIGPDDPYYQDMKKHFHLTDLDRSKYAASCFSSTGYQAGSSFNQPYKKDYQLQLVHMKQSELRTEKQK